MKTIILNSSNSQQEMLKYGSDLLCLLKSTCEVLIYDQVSQDFTNIKELYDIDDKIVLFNQFSVKGNWETFTAHLNSFKNIKYLLSPYASYKGLDLELVKKLGIRYRNNAGANAESVAQHAVMCMFMLLGEYPQLGNLGSIPDGKILGEQLQGKTAGIIGMGHVGNKLAAMLQGLGLEVVFYNRTAKEIGAKQVPFDQIFKKDIIFITIATNPDTEKLFANISALVQKHNYIVDISALDELYNKKEMATLLDKNRLKGYAFETNFPEKYRNTSNGNLLVTPHMAWCTINAEKATVQNYLGRAIQIVKGNASEVDFIV